MRLAMTLTCPFLTSGSCEVGDRGPALPCRNCPGLCHRWGPRAVPSPRPRLWHDPTVLGVPRMPSSCHLTRHLHAHHHAIAGGVADVAPRVAGLRPADGELPQHPAGLDLHPLTRLHLLAIPEPAHGGIGPGELTGQHQVLPGQQAVMLHSACAAHDGHRWLWGWRDGLSPQEQQPVLGAAMARSCPDLLCLQLGRAGVSTEPPRGCSPLPVSPPPASPRSLPPSPAPHQPGSSWGPTLVLAPLAVPPPPGPPAHLPQ